MGPGQYDTKEGIEESLVSLEAFDALVRERREAGYNREETLSEFVVMGRYALDTCGNFGFIEDALTECLEKAPKVCAKDEFLKLNSEGITVVHRGRPRPSQWCMVCRRQWTLENLGDSVDIGRDGAYAHKMCSRLRSAGQELTQFLKVLDLAKIKDFEIKPIPNGYWSSDRYWATPWYEITTPWGPITMGWRKRVIEIDWTETGAKHLFEDDVTKRETMIHAWSYLDAARYLDAIRRKLEYPA